MGAPAWRIRYSDGSTYEGDPSEAPGWGAITIVQYGGAWWGHDYAGLLDCLALPGPNIVVHGRSVSKPVWQKMLAESDQDSDFPPREDRYIMHGWDHYCWHGDAA